MKRRILIFENKLRRSFLSRFKGHVIKKVGIVSCDKFRGHILDDLLLQRYFLKHGVVADIISWQDEAIEYGNYNGLIIGSMWGYQNYLEDFSKWLSKIEDAGLVVINPLSVIRENYDKSKQFEILKKAGLPIIDTSTIGVGQINKLKDFARDVVIKPAISGSGENTFLVHNKGEFDRLKKKLEMINKERELLVQPFISEICKGELGVVMVGGKIVNVVRRFPGILEGNYKVELVPKNALSEEAAQLARKVADLTEYKQAVYLRIDMVFTREGYRLMEVEAFEPQLYYYLLSDDLREKMLGLMFDNVMRQIDDSKR